MKKKIIRGISAALCLVFLLATLTACGEKGKVKDQISAFEAACQAGDMDAVMDCFDPNVIGPMKSVAGVLGAGADAVFGLVYDAIGSGVAAALGTQSDAIDQILSSIQIKPTGYTFNDAKDTCSVAVTYSVTAFGETHTAEGTLKCILREDQWYLAVL